MGEFVKRCPEPTREATHKAPRVSLVEEAAQELLDWPQDTHSIIGDLRSELQIRYSDMFQNRSDRLERTAHKIEQGSHLASKGALFRLRTDRFIRNTSTLLQNGGPSILTVDDNLDLSSEDTFKETLEGWWAGALRDTVTEIKSDPNHPYMPVWNHAQKSWAPYWEHTKKFEPSRKSHDDFEEHLYAGATEDVDSIYEIMAQAKQAVGGDVNAAELTQITSRNIETLSWLASINRTILREAIFNKTNPEPLLEYKEGKFIFVHSALKGSLKDGPWDPAGNCIGRFDLTTDEGTSNATIALLKVGAQLAEHTIFAD